jgi:hypothetical protein
VSNLLPLCPAHGCLRLVEPGRAFCDECWKDVPFDLKDWIARNWGIEELADEFARGIKYAVRSLKKQRDKA